MPVRGYEDLYEVSNLGRVRRNGHCLIGSPAGKGYNYIFLSRNNVQEPRYRHHIVAEAFIGPRPEGMEVNHIDGVKSNNAVKNLEYTTSSGNKLHALRIGLRTNVGEGHPNTKFSDDAVREIRKLAAEGVPHKQIAKRFGVACEQYVSAIYRRVARAEVRP